MGNVFSPSHRFGPDGKGVSNIRPRSASPRIMVGAALRDHYSWQPAPRDGFVMGASTGHRHFFSRLSSDTWDLDHVNRIEIE